MTEEAGGRTRSIVPGPTLPQERHRWAGGQYLTFPEGEAVFSAALYVIARTGRSALPIHDALVVPESSKAVAREVLTRSFHSLLRIVPRIK